MPRRLQRDDEARQEKIQWLPRAPPFFLIMNNIDIRKTLRDIAREVFSDDTLEITDELSQDDVKAWDSLGHIRLIAATEDAFQITFTMDEIEGLKRMGQIVELIAEKA
jgi:acyl carrier protein